MSVGKRIRELRDKIGLTQAQFAEQLFRDKSSISKLENDEIKLSISMCRAITLTYNVRREWLMDGSGEMTKELQDAALIDQVVELSSRRRGVNEIQASYPIKRNIDKRKLAEDIELATRVLKSDTGYATALHMNIRSFADAVEERDRRIKLEIKQSEFEQKVGVEIETLKHEFGTLKAENLILHTENNRLKSTYEAPDGSNGDPTLLEKQVLK